MSHRTFSRFRLISITLFVLGLVSATVALSLHQANKGKLRHRIGFTLTTRDWGATVNPPIFDSPKIIRYSMAVRYQKSDGTWKEIRKYFNSKDELVKKEISMGIPGQGVFKINNATHELEFLSSMAPIEQTSYVKVTDGHENDNYLGTDVVHGYEAYVLRFPDDDGGYHDHYFVPALDNTCIKRVSWSPFGIGIDDVIDIKIGEPDEKAFDGLPKWLINYDHFKRKIATIEERGQHDTAEAMRKELASQIAKQERQQ